MKYLFRFILNLNETKILEELMESGECVLEIRQEGERVIVVSEKRGSVVGEGIIETWRQ